MSTSEKRPAFAGPHEGRELELMVVGAKPLSMFLEPVPPEYELFPERQFDLLVAEGKLIKNVSPETITGPDGRIIRFRRVLYALPEEAWRIKAMLLVQGLYDSMASGWRPDLDRVIGLLLGYEPGDIERFLESKGL